MIKMFKSRRNFIIFMILFLAVGVSIGYAYLASLLNITGTTAISQNSWIIYFDNIVENEENVTATNSAVIEPELKQRIDFDVPLDKKMDMYEFDVDIVNDGTIDAMIDRVIKSSLTTEQLKYLEYTITYDDEDKTPIQKCDLLEKKSRRKIIVRVKLKNGEEFKMVDAENLHLSFEINYVQKTACDPESEDTYKLIIDPKGGLFKNSREKYVIENLHSGQEVKIEDMPILEDSSFNDWKVVRNDQYDAIYDNDSKTVTILNSDAYIEADYTYGVRNVARINQKYYTSIQKAFDDAVSGDMIYLLVDTEESPVNRKLEDITLNLDGYKVDGMLTNNGRLTLLNLKEGTTSWFKNENGYGAVNNGILTLGNVSDEVDTTSIALIGSSYNGGLGLKQSGVFNFYDGYLEGFIGLDGIYQSIADDHFMFVDHNTDRNCQKVYLTTQPDRAVSKIVWENGATAFYFNLQDSFNSGARVNLPVYAIRNFEGAYQLSVPKGKTVVFDLAGFVVETGNTITNNGIFTIKDSSAEKGQMMPSVAIVNNGTLTIDNINMVETTDSNVIDNKGDLNLVRSIIKAKDGYAINIMSGDSLIMDDETILNADKFALNCNTKNDFRVKGGTISGIYNTGNLVIEKGTNIKKITFADDTYGIYNSGNVAVLTLENLELEINNSGVSTYAVYCDNPSSKVIVNGGELVVNSTYTSADYLDSKAGATVIYNGDVTVNDGILKATNPNGAARTVYALSNIKVNGGELIAEGYNTANLVSTSATIGSGKMVSRGSNSAYTVFFGRNIVIDDGADIVSNDTCLYMSQGTTTVNGGTIHCPNYFVYGYTGNYNYGNYGTVNINGGTINSDKYGIYGTGNINMSGGVVDTNLTALYLTNSRTSNINITGGSVSSSSEYAIYSNNSNNEVVISQENNETNLYGKRTGIFMEAGKLKLKDGSVTGEDEYGVYLKDEGIIGVDDGDVSISKPLIMGKYYGLYVFPNVYTEMYDGLLKGLTAGYIGVITGVADGKELYEDDVEIVDDTTYHLCYLGNQQDYVRVGNVTFNSLQKAFDYITDTGTATILKTYSIKNPISLASGKKVTLDFDGYTLNLTRSITNNGELIFTDNNSEKTGGIKSSVNKPIINNNKMIFEKGNYSTNYGMLIYNAKELVINDGKFSIDVTNTNGYVIYDDVNSTLSINGGLISATGSVSQLYGIYNVYDYYDSRKPNAFINDGVIEVTSTNSEYNELTRANGAIGIFGGKVNINTSRITAINNDGLARCFYDVNSLIIEDGTYTSNGKNIAVMSYTNATLNGGTYTAIGTNEAYDIYNNGSGKTIVINGESNLSSNHICIDSNDSDLTVNGGSFTCEDSFMMTNNYSDYVGKIIINDGTINSSNYGIKGKGIININGGLLNTANVSINLTNEKNESMVTINGGIIKSATSYGLYSNSSENIITIGEEDKVNIDALPYIEGKTTSIYLNNGILNANKANIVGLTDYGVYSNGITTFGIDDDDVSVTLPMVKGERSAVYINTKTTTNINDGIYKGIESGYDGFISGFPDSYTIVTDSEIIGNKNYVTNYLQEQEYFVRAGEETFNSLQKAIDYIEETGTIEVIANHVMKTDTVIPAEKNITIDFNGHTLIFSKSISNYGTLIMADSENNGGITAAIENPITDMIINYNSLIINGGNYSGLNGNVFFNKGNMEFNDGVVTVNSDNNIVSAIYSECDDDISSKVTINGGSIEVSGSSLKTYGIYSVDKREYDTDNKVEIIVNDGTLITTSSNSGRDNNSDMATLYGGYIIVNNGTIKAKTTSDLTAKVVNTNKKIVINDGIVEVEGNNSYGIIASNFQMNGGVITANGTNNVYGISVTSNGEINNDSIINSQKVCVFNTGIITINSGTLNCETNGIEGATGYNDYASFNVNGGVINALNDGIITRGTINYKNGLINAQRNGINLSSSYSSILNITGGKINAKTEYGINSNSKDNTITIGKDLDTSIGDEPFIYGNTYGIYLGNGTLSLGKKDDNIDLDNFIIQGGEYGVYNADYGIMYFYDGILKGTLSGYEGTINEIEAGTFVFTDADVIDDVDYVTNYLIKDIDVIENVRTEKKYASVQMAIDEAETDDELRLIENVQLYYEVVVDTDSDVVLNLNTHSIVSTRRFINNGTVKIYDSNTSEKGSLSTSLNINLIKNSGSLEIDGLLLKNSLNRDASLIVNDAGGNIELNDVTLYSNNNIDNSGVLNLNNCNLTASSTAIVDKGIINIDNSTIVGNSRALYSSTNTDGIIANSTISSSNSSVYKYNGSSKLSISDTDIDTGYVYNNGGTLEVINGTIENYIRNYATLNINGTTITDEDHTSGIGWNDYTSIINTSRMHLENVNYSLEASNNGSVTVIENRGVFESKDSNYDTFKTIDYYYCWDGRSPCGGNYGYIIKNTGSIDSNGSEYSLDITDPSVLTNPKTNMYGIYNTGSGTVKTNGDSYTVDKGILSYGIYTTLSSHDNVLKDTTINVRNAKNEYGIYNVNGDYTLDNTVLNVSNTENAYGLYIDTGKYTMITGNVNVSTTNTAYGAYVNKNDAQLTLGVFDGGGSQDIDISFDNPEIKAIGTRTGIGIRKVNGFFNFYDGIIIGNTNAKPDTTSDVEYNYEATNYYDAENDYVYCKLEYMVVNTTNLSSMVARIDNTYYRSLNDAFNKAKSGETIKLLKAIEDSPTNNNNQPITLDLNGFIIAGTITNNGALTIINSQSSSSQINGGESEGIVNNNRLIIGVDDTNIINDSIVILSENVSVMNSGTMMMYDGYIKGNKALRGNNIVTSLYSKVVKTDADVDGMETIYIESSSDITEAVFEFDYVGNEQSFVAPEDGLYKLEVWGASGGQGYQNGSLIGTPGYGGYSSGIISLKAGDRLFINVGGKGEDGSVALTASGGYNGGGSGSSSIEIAAGGGGGATSIATRSGKLVDLENYEEDIVIVAGGGGGTVDSIGGSGGGFKGGINSNTNASTATQISGYKIGLGESGVNGYSYAGAGSGYYGGYVNKNNGRSSGTGGSGYIAYESLTDKYMTCFSCTTSAEEDYKTYSTTKHSDEPISNYGKSGNGYARIKRISLDNYLTSITYSTGVLKDKDGLEEVEFTYDIYEYRLDVDMYTNSIDLSGETSDPAINVNRFENQHIEIGDNILELIVSDDEGNTKVYSINVHRESLKEGEHSSKIRQISFDESLINPNLLYLNYDDNSFEIYIKPETSIIEPVISLYDSEATYVIEDNVVPATGSGTMKIIVSAPEVEDTIYTFDYKVKSITYEYTGSIQEFTAPTDGVYTIEAWGAQGGAADYNATSSGGGFGGYTTAQVLLSEGQTIYFAIGGKGLYGAGENEFGGSLGGYNGGGSAGTATSGSGGGATSVSFISGELKDLENNKESIILVAGGGGGSDASGGNDGNGGSGGGFIGGAAKVNGTLVNRGRYNALNISDGGSGMGATQENGYAFGLGESVGINMSTGGAGAGYYGGYVTHNSSGGAGGGSGYFDYGKTFKAKMVCYNCETSSNPDTLTESTTNNSDVPMSDYVKKGDGALRITYEGKAIDNNYLSDFVYSAGRLYDISGDNRIRFDKRVTDYMIKVDMYTTAIDLDFETEVSSATVDGLKHIELNVGYNEVPITVTAQNGDIRVYTIIINREVDPILRTSIKAIKFNDKVVKDIYPKKNEYQYDIDVFCSTLSFDIDLEFYVDDVTYEISGSDSLDDSGTIIISVTDGVDESIYKINYVRSCSIEYDYTGTYQEFIAPETGLYKLEVWGAEGGSTSQTAGGRGGYASGEIYLVEGKRFYVYVGSSGTTSGTAGGYNGGGSHNTTLAGGGATDIRTEIDDLYSRLIVAGGGGGAGSPGRPGGYGGGLEGGSSASGCGDGGTGATQTSAGSARASFGYGGSGWSGNGGNGGAGGGGWYGGGGNNADGSADDDKAGGGGSGFVLTAESLPTTPYGYKLNDDYFLNNTQLIGGNLDMPTYDGESTKVGNSGDGYAKITYISNNEFTKNDINIEYYLDNDLVSEMPDDSNYFGRSECDEGVTLLFNEELWDYVVSGIETRDTLCKLYFNSAKSDFDYSGVEEEYIAPKSGYYRLEVWGAEGGRTNVTNGGKGGYTSGELYLFKGQKLYVNVGAAGSNGGYNGGGAHNTTLAGGGATDIRTIPGNLYSRFIVAGGGGGAGSPGRPGGYGGGLEGGSSNSGCGDGGTGATQTSAGSARASFGYGGSGWSGNGGNGGAGGGGWYGGGGNNADGSADDDKAGGGGSGFVLTAESLPTTPYGYKLNDDYFLNNTQLIGGNLDMPTYDGESTKVGNSGDGYAKITYISNNEFTKNDINIEYYLDNDLVSEMPDDSNYFGRSECDEGVTLLFNEELWDYVVSGIETRDTLCKLYFNSAKSDFDYSGVEEEYIAPKSGYYRLEVWGAEGGRTNVTNGGKGGYTSGELYLFKGQKLYVNVGAAGSNGGYNGGGAHNTTLAGGGATDIRTIPGNLYSRFIVAGGGGGAGSPGRPGGYGGGLEGGSSNSGYGDGGTGATQNTAGSARASFGQGGSGLSRGGGNGGAGGGGWYGGGGNNADGSGDDDKAGGGGSGFALSQESFINTPIGYLLSNDYYLSNITMIAGNEEMPSARKPNYTVIGNSGHGYAKITYIDDGSNNYLYDIYISSSDSENIILQNNKYEYDVNVSKYVKSVDILVNKVSDYATVTGLGNHILDSDSKVINVTVTAQNGDVNVYKITVNRENDFSDSTEIRKIEFNVDGVSIVETRENVFEYDITFPTGTSEVSLDIDLFNDNASYSIEGADSLNESGVIKITVTYGDVSTEYNLNYHVSTT